MRYATDSAIGLDQDAATVFDRFEPLRIRYEAGELICQARSYAAGVHLITSGIALESYRTSQHDVAPLATDLLGPGDLLGTELLLSDKSTLHMTSCRAVTSVSLLFLERSAFDAALEANASLSQYILSQLTDRSQRLIRMLWRLQLPVEDRFSELLHELVRLGERKSRSDAVHLPKEIDLRLIAGLAGVPLRRSRQVCATLQGVEWTDEGLRLIPDRLPDPEGAKLC